MLTKHIAARGRAASVRRRLLQTGVVALALSMAPVRGEEEARAPGPAEVATAVARLRADIDVFRFVMGAPIVAETTWSVTAAAPRHALYTAETLFAKVNRLAQEVAGTPRALPPTSAARDAAATLAVVASAHEVLRDLMRSTGVSPADEPPPPRGPTFAAALVDMVEANRQLNAMLLHEYRPAEIHGLVIAAMAHVACVAGEPYPPLPPLRVGFTSTDVYRVLLECYRLVREAEAAADMATLALNLRRERRRQDVPASDVYDIARLLLADITSMACEGDAQRTAPPYPRPSYVYAAHVHRLAGVLEAMLRTLGA